MLNKNLDVIKSKNNLFAAYERLEKIIPDYNFDESRILCAKSCIRLALELLNDDNVANKERVLSIQNEIRERLNVVTKDYFLS